MPNLIINKNYYLLIVPIVAIPFIFTYENEMASFSLVHLLPNVIQNYSFPIASNCLSFAIIFASNFVISIAHSDEGGRVFCSYDGDDGVHFLLPCSLDGLRTIKTIQWMYQA